MELQGMAAHINVVEGENRYLCKAKSGEYSA